MSGPQWMRLSTALFVTAVFQLPPANTSAQENAPEEENEPQTTVSEKIVVSANRIEQPSRQVGSSVTVIEREEIESRHKTTMLELLRTVPGVSVVQSGGPGKAASIFIRGGNSAHTLVLIDGVRVNGNTSGSFDFSDLTPDNIERIEVVRGPQGTLYGSEAVAGVIAITTRRGTGPASFWAVGELGSDEHSLLRVGTHGGDEKLDYSFSAATVSTDGVSAASEEMGNTEQDPWENQTFSGRLGVAFAGDGRADLALRLSDGDTDIDGFTFGVGPTDDLNARQKEESFSGALTVTKPFAPWWKQTFFLGSSRDELEGEDPDNEFGNFEIIGKTTEFLTQSEFTLSENDTLTFGYRVEKREAENVGSFDDSLYLRSFFLENLWSFGDRFHFSASVRSDDHTKFGSETTYRLTTSLLFGTGSRFHGSFGTGFKAPTFNDLFFPGFGNPSLKPETSEGFDLGFEQTLLDEHLVFDLTYFDTEFEDLILFTFPDGFVNVASATADGFELGVRFEPTPRFLLRASHTRTETEDAATGLQLARRPKDKSSLYLAFRPLEKLWGTVSLVVVQDRIDSDGSPMDDYERVDFTLEYRIREGLRPYLRVENLFDENYAEVPGFTTPGAVTAIGLHVGF